MLNLLVQERGMYFHEITSIFYASELFRSLPHVGFVQFFVEFYYKGSYISSLLLSIHTLNYIL